MPIEEIIDVSTETTSEIMKLLGSIGIWLQAIGLIIVFWLIINLINWYLNRKRTKEIYKIKEDIQRLESKIDEILERLKRKKTNNYSTKKQNITN